MCATYSTLSSSNHPLRASPDSHLPFNTNDAPKETGSHPSGQSLRHPRETVDSASC